MKLGVGLPNPIPGTPGRLLVDWSRRAEELGFEGLATIDRIAYPSYESLVALAAAAAVTERIGLLTNVLLAPTRIPVLLAKEAASVDQLSGGRLTLGLGVGAREDDFTSSGQSFHRRGRAMDGLLELLVQAWRGEPVAGSPKPVTPSPARDGAVPILIGGTSEQALKRMVKWGVGWTSGGAPPDAAAAFAEKARQAWREGGREGEPRLAALAYFALGPRADEGAQSYLGDYYGFAPWGKDMWQGIPRSPEAVKEMTGRFQDAGFDELYLDPTIAELDQLDRLAEALL